MKIEINSKDANLFVKVLVIAVVLIVIYATGSCAIPKVGQESVEDAKVEAEFRECLTYAHPEESSLVRDFQKNWEKSNTLHDPDYRLAFRESLVNRARGCFRCFPGGRQKGVR